MELRKGLVIGCVALAAVGAGIGLGAARGQPASRALYEYAVFQHCHGEGATEWRFSAAGKVVLQQLGPFRTAMGWPSAAGGGEGVVADSLNRLDADGWELVTHTDMGAFETQIRDGTSNYNRMTRVETWTLRRRR